MGRRGLDGVAHARCDEGIRAITQTIEERVNAALDKVRPGIAADGGEVWLIKVETGIAYVQMLGACGGCPASTMTLKGAIETIVRADVPEIQEVVEI
ncbi:MAG TPA: NifU family protein [Candidatus Baltobacteraceae bacterium]|jgi:Fe-S cluster biogenesis protein NfuA|nr:NifU family protein [Candidatus Baltobacteraceae bacterium]